MLGQWFNWSTPVSTAASRTTSSRRRSNEKTACTETAMSADMSTQNTTRQSISSTRSEDIHLLQRTTEQHVSTVGDGDTTTIDHSNMHMNASRRERSQTLQSIISSPGVSFHPPLTHTIPKLKPFHEYQSCYHCGSQFTFYRRKYHCHYCGSVCCYYCTQNTRTLPQFGYYNPVSVCDYCNKFIPLSTMTAEELEKQRPRLLRNYVIAFDLSVEVPPPEDKATLISIILAAQPLSDRQEKYFRTNLPESPIRPVLSLFAASIEQLLLGRNIDYDEVELTPEMMEEREQFEQMLAQLYGFDTSESFGDGHRSAGTDASSSTEKNTAALAPPPPPPSITTIIAENIDLETLSIATLRNILNENCVSYEPKLDKDGLLRRVQRLVDNTAREMAKHAQSAAQDDSTCRICCDAHINAVFLECGHMAACMPCAKRLQQEERNVCPICREPITRVVHVFRT